MSAFCRRALFFLPLAAVSALCEEKPTENKEAPVALLCAPLGVPAGSVSRVTLRGLRLDTVTAARFAVEMPAARLQLMEKGKAVVPSQVAPGRAGDTQVVLELTLPANARMQQVEVILASPTGEAKPRRIIVDAVGSVDPEKEPNGSFREAQEIALDRPVEGSIAASQDVDVYRWICPAGREVWVEALADREGSALDPIVTVYDAAGHVMSSSDDITGCRDSRVQVKLQRESVCYVSIQDANDTGGPSHPYRLFVYTERTAAF